MQITTFEGIIENGRVVFNDDVRLPEKTTVFVIVPSDVKSSAPKKFDLLKMIEQMPAHYRANEEDFTRFSVANLERAFGSDEPEYSLDLIKEANPKYEGK